MNDEAGDEMELPKIRKSDRGVLDGIKSKLGFATEQADDFEDDNYDDYGDDYTDYDDGYGTYEDYEHGGSAGAYVPASGQRSGSGSRGPNLVSIDDVKANTQVPQNLNRDPLASSRQLGTGSAYVPSSTSHYRSGYTRSPRRVERAADYMISTETSDLPGEGLGPQPSGYDSLFSSPGSPTTPREAAAAASGSFDPYETYSGKGQSSHNPTRSLRILKPVSYAEVEQVAKIVKAGDVVVLSLKNTPDHLAKRILDFAFGVASALDSSVDCITDKVFVIIRGQALGNDERTYLRSQGVL